MFIPTASVSMGKTNALSGGGGFFGTIGNAISGAWDSVKNGVSSVYNTVTGWGTKVYDSVTGLVTNVGEGVKAVGQGVGKAVESVGAGVAKIPDAASSIGQSLSLPLVLGAVVFGIFLLRDGGFSGGKSRK